MDKYELVKELWDLYTTKHRIEKELTDYFHQLAQEKANFKEGEVVSVYEDGGKYQCDGIVDGIFHGLNYGWEAFDIKAYITSPDKFAKAILDIRYRVKAIKKDGSKSERNALGQASFGESHNNCGRYIGKK